MGVAQPQGPIRKSERFAQIFVLALLYAAPAWLCIHAACVSDPDVWWHMRTGEWILRHHAVPHTDPFSISDAGKPWAAYSWLFDLAVYLLFQLLGLAGLLVYSAGLVLSITIALHHLIRRLCPDFTIAALLTFAACFAMAHLYTPRPWLFTILFFILELDILMYVRETGQVQRLIWLPLLFAAWANLHIQFINGLLVLLLAFAESAMPPRFRWATTRAGSAWLGLACGASVVATWLNPYGWHIYKVAYDLAAQPGVLNKISELQAIPFRSLPDYCLLLIALAAAGSLAMHRRVFTFEGALLTFAAVLSFRSQRDMWVMAIVGSVILASSTIGAARELRRGALLFTPLAALGACLILGVASLLTRVTNPSLGILLANGMPVRAVEFIKEKHYGGSIYNDYAWGGYLIWSLRLPVIIDGRAALHGDQQIDRSLATWNAAPDWNSDPGLLSSSIVIGPVKAPLMQVLRTDTSFRLVFVDKIAAVFIARGSETTPTQ